MLNAWTGWLQFPDLQPADDLHDALNNNEVKDSPYGVILTLITQLQSLCIQLTSWKEENIYNNQLMIFMMLSTIMK